MYPAFGPIVPHRHFLAMVRRLQPLLLLLLLFHGILGPPTVHGQGLENIPIDYYLRFLAPPWSYACQAPIPLGRACQEDNDCDTGADTGRPAQHCHLQDKVCSYPLAEGGWCNEGRHCGPGLGCLATSSVMECFELLCDESSGNLCTQGRPTGKLCGVEGAAPNLSTWGCATDGSEICNNSLRPHPSGRCHPVPEEEGADCTFFIASSTACGNGMLCTMGTGNCLFAVGGPGQPCPMPPNRCEMSQGLVCQSEHVEPFQSTCQAPKPLGAACSMGGECGPGAYCDVHDLTCRGIRPVGSRCQGGNECGEAPFDDHRGVDCVRQSCVDTSREGADCWPGFPKNQCTQGRTCRRRQVVSGTGVMAQTAATAAAAATTWVDAARTPKGAVDGVGVEARGEGAREEMEVRAEEG